VQQTMVPDVSVALNIREQKEQQRKREEEIRRLFVDLVVGP
jgi:hypothetical protein